MNEIVNKRSLAGNKYMIKMHLKQCRFIYSVRGTFSKKRENTKT